MRLSRSIRVLFHSKMAIYQKIFNYVLNRKKYILRSFTNTMHIDSVDTQILINLNHVFSSSISTLFLIFLKNNLFSIFAPSKSEWLNSFTSTWMKNRQGPKAKKESTWMDSQIHEDPSPDTIELINFKYCQHRFFVSIDSDQKKGQCVFLKMQTSTIQKYNF